jgi:hypothetical protein
MKSYIILEKLEDVQGEIAKLFASGKYISLDALVEKYKTFSSPQDFSLIIEGLIYQEVKG